MKKRSYRENIRRFFILYALVPLGVLMVLFVVVMGIMPRAMMRSNAAESNNTLRIRVEKMLAEYNTFIREFASSEALLSYMHSEKASEKVFALFYNFNKQATVQCAMHVFNATCELRLSSRTLEKRSEQFVRIALQPQIDRMLGDPLFGHYTLNYQKDFPNAYTVAQAIVDAGKTTGYVILQLSEQSLGDYLKLNSTGNTIVTDKHNNIIYSNQAKSLKFDPGETDEYVLADGTQFYVHRSKVGELNIYTLSAYPSYRLLYFAVAAVVLFTGVFLFVVLQLLATRMSKQNGKAMDRLLNVVERMQKGERNLVFEMDSEDEFEELAHQYKMLSIRIETLLQNNEELAELKRSSEMRALEGQFHPHYILNALETLRYSLYLNTGVSHEIIDLLANQLKYSLYHSSKVVRLSDDLHYIGEYIKLHQIRFDNRISIQVDVQDVFKKAIVPKLVLQPLIENSVKYGFRYQESLKIRICAAFEGDDMIISVYDNGHGLKQKEFEALLKTFESNVQPDKHIGLYNINRRLMLLHGEMYHIMIQNNEGESFMVTLRIPYQTEE